MSEDDNHESMRPIPDGGLKEAMPAWLKRPPAWRSMASAEERHERTMPEPDTSEIDPRSLVDISDLPQWLQTIAARGDVPAPIADHAIGQLQRVADTPAEAETVPDAAADPVANDVVDVAPPVIAIPEASPAWQSTRVLWITIAVLIVLVLLLGAMQLI